MKYKYPRLLATLFISLLVASGLFAQTATTGAIEGRVTDGNVPLPGVTVEVRSPALQGTKTTVTDANGQFRFALLPPGTYSLGASLSGFAGVSRSGIVVNLGRTVSMDVTMRPAAIAEEITVTAEAPVVDVTSARAGVNVRSEQFERLPLQRDFYSVAQVAPGISEDAVGTTVYGSTGAENQYIIEGLNTTGVERGDEGKVLNFDFIDEVEVITGGLPAEYGRTTGGIINVITKSGGNEFDGSVFGFFSGGDLREETKTEDRPHWTTTVPDVEDDFDYGFDLGGYIMKDRLWFFAAYDRVERQDISELIQPLVIPGQPTIPVGTTFPTDVESDRYAGKLTFTINPNHTLVGSIFGDPTTSTGAQFAIEGPSSTYFGIRDTGGDDFVGRYSGIFGGDLLVNAMVAGHREDDTLSGPGTELVAGRDLTVSPAQRSGGFLFFQNQEFNRDVYKLDVSKFFGNHDIKIGGDYEDTTAANETAYGGGQRLEKLRARGPDGQLGTADDIIYYRHRFFVQEEGLDKDNPATWRIAHPLVSEPVTENTSIYIQDSWKVLPNFSVNFGVRWETQEISGRGGITNIEIDDNWAPRVGLIWDVLNNGRSKLYANYGRFYESIPQDINIRSFGGELIAFSHNFDPNPANITPDPSAPSRSSILGGEATPVDPDLKGQYIDEFLLGYEYELRPNLAVGIKGTYRDLGRVIEDMLIVDEGTYFIANPGDGIGTIGTFYDYTTAPSPEAKREFTGVELFARKRYANNWQLFASYLWSKLEGNYDGTFQVSTGQLDPNINSAFDYLDFLVNAEGDLSNDREHQFKIYGSYNFAGGALDGLNIGASAFYESGTPLTAMGYSFAYANWEYYLVPRGSLGTGPDAFEADLHVGYPIRFGPGELNLLVDVFNVLDSQDIRRLDTRYNLPEHGHCGAIPEDICNGDNGLLHSPGSVEPIGRLTNPRATSPNPSFLKKGVEFTGPRTIRFGVRYRF